MGIEYRLTIASDDSAEAVAARAIPDPAMRPTPTESGRLLASDPYAQLGFSLTIRADTNGYYHVIDSDDGWWTWEPAEYVDLTFRMSMEDDDHIDKGIPNMLTIVARVLDTGPDDAALILQDDTLLLTRLSGVMRKHSRSSWWDHYGFVHEILPD